MSKVVELGSVKEGSWILIDNEPCQVVEVSHSKPGKHGSAKARVVGIGLFDDAKHTLMSPVDEKVEVPMIEKRNAQVLALLGDHIQVMDLETYDTLELPMPKDSQLASSITVGVTVEYWKVQSRAKIMRIKS
ncbi:MAG: translation initiation factor IF-5A [Thermoproteota archaeon]|nr:translation initiation factor IF-5A [Candidatus Brockarchaeota archaeon]MBO3768360.1 translation initiation factor IF-5A [Candidatus Brockarchaeota archaeon]MBO3800798.1 translation initiation factor IF-5A [Candidatus Brockarchaeota archaeon]